MTDAVGFQARVPPCDHPPRRRVHHPRHLALLLPSERVIDDIAERLAPADPRCGRVKTLSVFALMVGTLEVSRALADRRLADEVLEQGIENALALLGSPRHG